MRIVLVLAIEVAAAACGGGRAERAEAGAGPARPAAEPVRIDLGWVVAAAPTEVEEVECKLVLRIVRPGGGKEEMHEMGAWWRAQKAVVEMVEVKSARGPVFFRTEAAFGSDGDLTRSPHFEVMREAGGAVIVRGRDDDTPWRQLERVEVAAEVPVEARRLEKR